MDPPADRTELDDMRRRKPTLNARTCRCECVAVTYLMDR